VTVASTNDPATSAQPSAFDDLVAVDAARWSAVEGTRHPKWVFGAFSVALGTAFGFALLRTTFGWVVGASVFGIAIVGMLVLSSHMKRRRGRLLNLSRGNALRFFIVYGAVLVIGQLSSGITWQPWFAMAGGAFLALVSYGYLLWDDAAMSKKLATGDFAPGDLMP